MSGGWFDEEAIEAERLDADMEMAELQRSARQAEADRKRGRCHHTWTQPTKPGVLSGARTCNHCGRADLPADHWPGQPEWWGQAEAVPCPGTYHNGACRRCGDQPGPEPAEHYEGQMCGRLELEGDSA
jgi:hypothetical protein